jgi:ribosomal protein S12 methylthiotransferase
MTKKRNKSAVQVGFVALGCPKNMVDSERMLAEIGRAGFVITPELDGADVVVINTCGFIEPAKAEAVEVIREAVGYKKKNGFGKVIVAGCLSQRHGEGLFSQVEGVDAIVGLEQRDNIATIIKRTLAVDRPQVFLDSTAKPGRRKRKQIHNDRGRMLLTPGHWAYLRISEGCNHGCSFCTVPAIRGPFRSKPTKMLLAEAKELVDYGVVELILVAQDSGSYGRDLKAGYNLERLVKGLAEIDGLQWIRLMYLYPTLISDGLNKTIADCEKVVKYLDIPVQHISSEILKSMRRGGDKEQINGLIEKLRANIPGLVLRTTVIVGYPGETDEHFSELLDFVKWARFDALGCFMYYPEAGTPAAKLPGQLPDEVKRQRYDELMTAQQGIAFDNMRRQLGGELLCLVDEVDNERGAVGRYYGQAPHIDGVCLINNCSEGVGRFMKVRIVDTRDYDFIVEQI